MPCENVDGLYPQSPSAVDGFAATTESTAAGTSLHIGCSEYHYKNSNNSLKILLVMCYGLKKDDNSDLLDLNKDPWISSKVTTYRPGLLELKKEVTRRSSIIIATKMGGKVTKKDQPSPSQWTIIKCQNWLESSPITDPSDVNFLRTELQLRLNVLTKAVEQKKSEDQKLLIHDDDGKNWCGNDPILRLIHTLDDTVIRRAYMTRHNISNSRIVLDNAKSVEKREETVWQMMARKWNDEKFTPMTMALSPELCTQ
jgi:hypothetical protein